MAISALEELEQLLPQSSLPSCARTGCSLHNHDFFLSFTSLNNPRQLHLCCSRSVSPLAQSRISSLSSAGPAHWAMRSRTGQKQDGGKAIARLPKKTVRPIAFRFNYVGIIATEYVSDQSALRASSFLPPKASFFSGKLLVGRSSRMQIRPMYRA